MSIAALVFTFTTVLPTIKKTVDQTFTKYIDPKRKLSATRRRGTDEYTAQKNISFAMGKIWGDDLNSEAAKNLFDELKAAYNAQEAV